MVRAVLFDLGDTLWHFPAMPPRAVRLARSTEQVAGWLMAAGYDRVDAAALAEAILDADWQASSAAYAGDLRSPHYPTLVQAVAAAHNLALDPEQALDLWHAHNVGGLFLQREIFPDALPTLHALRERGFRLGCVTNRALGGPLFVEELRGHEMHHLFDSYAISCDDGWLKPAPTLYQKALDELGVAPAEAVMVGDSLRADVAGAQALGIVAVWKRPLKPTTEPATHPDGRPIVPDYVIDHPRDLLDLPILQRPD